ncbi:MAG: ComEC/Rec2 family competence protein [Patescibacteria group bacterium]|nr:ComEC/Rec2 family competence protein [Patescibacteria group bacterium]
MLLKSRIFYFLCLAFIAGIALASFVNLKFLKFELIYFALAMFSLILAIIFWQNFNFRFIALLGLFLFLGIWRYAIFLPNDSIDKVWHYNNQTIELGGQIVSEVKYDANKQKILFGKIIKNNKKLDGQVLLMADSYPRYKYGDELKFECELQAPEPFMGFAYDRYLARHDIYSLCYYPKLKLISDNNCKRFFVLIYKFKDYLRTRFEQSLDIQPAALAKAMLLGDKQGISDELRTKFSRAGISHVVAISGMHIGIITTIILLLINQAGLGRKASYILTSTFLFLFIIMVGLPASAVRAGIMGFLLLTATYLGRLNQLKYSLIIAAFILLIFNPFLLRDDIGWQLSFLAVFGIAFFYPYFEMLIIKYIPQKVIKIKIIKSILLIINITLSANIMVWPIVAYNFGVVSLVSPLSNLLILWTLPFLFVFLCFGLIFGFLPGLSFLIFKLAELLLFYIIKISELLINLPYAYTEIYSFNIYLIIIYYLILAYILFIIKGNKK